jgi:signal peptidase I
MDKDQDRVVLRRGMKEHDWRQPVDTPIEVPAPARARRLRLPAVPRVSVPRMVSLAAIAGIAAAFVAVFLVFSFHGFRAQGKSMEPELHDGDHLIVARIVYEEVDFGLLDCLPVYDSSDLRWGSPGRGDVIVFDSPVRDERLVKRVIGLPGDDVEIKNGTVYVNGDRLDEPYVDGDTDCLRTCEPVTVPDGHYFVLGDNREDSVDSRQGWTVARDAISGKVIISY